MQQEKKRQRREYSKPALHEERVDKVVRGASSGFIQEADGHYVKRTSPTGSGPNPPQGGR